MPKIRAFRGIRPHRDYASFVILDRDHLPPMSGPQIKKGPNPFSFLHVLAPANPEGGGDNQAAKAKFDSFMEEGIFIQDNQPSLYIYEAIQRDFSQKGVIGVASVGDYKSGKIKKHEHTRAERELQLAQFLMDIELNTTPVLLTHAFDQTLEDILFEATKHKADYHLFADDTEFNLWIVDQSETIAQLENCYAEMEAFYIADGHHRAKSAEVAADKLQARETDEAYWFSVILCAANQLKVFPFYRALQNTGLSKNEIKDRLLTSYTLKPVNLTQAFYQYLPEQHFIISFKDDAFELIPKAVLKIEAELDKLDVSILQKYILDEMFGITNPKTDKRLSFGSKNIPIDAFQAILQKPETDCIFLTRAPLIESMFKIADLEQVMPPKSTSFEPKIKSGLVLHHING